MDINYVRRQFPALAQDQVFMDNAAGSQVVKPCIDAIHDYLCSINVQPAAEYPVALQAISRLEAGYEAGASFINASIDEIVFGASTTQLVRNVSTALNFQPGDEIVLSSLDHEAHLAAWVQVADWKGLTVKFWTPSEKTQTDPKLEADDLEAMGLVTEKTRLVCFTHTSNILGSITDVAKITRAIKRINPKTLVSVDGVAYAPHAAIDAQAFGVDFYFFSWYKVYGPHMSMAFIKKSAQAELTSLGHHFLPKSGAFNMLNLAGGNYELIQSIPSIVMYLRSIGWDWIKRQEGALQEELLAFIRTRSEIQLYGDPSGSRDVRVPVVCFTVKGRTPTEVVREIYATSKCTPTTDRNFYAVRLFDTVLGPDTKDGVVRCSFLHYNTVEEVRELVRALKALLDKPLNKDGSRL
ncbi:hypothetical protein K4F52_008486 [Lecanicillium sp. MT-2017a]|nr:hypothetical protein K4F52_008486 [Lecanicillium sp. MT-2017a]